jgi:hypothetical protein
LGLACKWQTGPDLLGSDRCDQNLTDQSRLRCNRTCRSQTCHDLRQQEGHVGVWVQVCSCTSGMCGYGCAATAVACATRN